MYEDILMIIGIVLIVVIWSLKLIHIVVKVIITLIAVILILNYIGVLGGFNQPINAALTGTPATSCFYDSDCALKSISCEPCDCGSPVYKGWDKFCIFKDTRGTARECEPCPPKEYYHIICQEYNCVNSQ